MTGNRTPDQKLFYAAKTGIVADAMAALDAGADLNAMTAERETALHWAAGNGHTALARLLIDKAVERGIEQNVYVNAINHDLETPLHLAAKTGCTQIVQLLIEKDADLNPKDYKHRTPRNRAAEKGHADVVEWLDAATSEQRKVHTAQVEQRRRPVGPSLG